MVLLQDLTRFSARRSPARSGSFRVSFIAANLAALALSATFVGAATVPGHAEVAYKPAPAEAGTEIPKAEVRMGLLPYADGSFPIIGVKKGFFTDVGLTVTPVKVTEDESHSLLVRGDIDVSHGYPPNFLPTYQNSQVVKQIMFHDVIVAGCVLADPALKLKGFKDYFKEGKSFGEAMAAAMAPVKGQFVASTPVTNERLFEDTVAKLSGVTWKHKILDDANILVASKAHQIKFAHPSGAPVVYSLIKAGWTRLVCLDDLIDHGPKGKDSPIVRQIAAVGAEANGDWVNKNPNTALRYMSAVWRTIDAVTADPSLYDIQAPVLNSITGTKLTGEDIANTVKLFQPYIPFEQSAKFYTDDNSVLNYKRIYGQIIAAFEDSGVLPAGVTPDDFIWGGKMWQQLVDYRKQTDDLLGKLDKGSLPDQKKALVEQAQKYYGWRDYLDAYRFARAAASK
ncbi:MAG: hypothetical protein ACTHJ3_18800 [Pararhizobium sp.]